MQRKQCSQCKNSNMNIFYWHLLETQQNSDSNEMVGSSNHNEGAKMTEGNVEIQEESEVKIKLITIFYHICRFTYRFSHTRNTIIMQETWWLSL